MAKKKVNTPENLKRALPRLNQTLHGLFKNNSSRGRTGRGRKIAKGKKL